MRKFLIIVVLLFTITSILDIIRDVINPDIALTRMQQKEIQDKENKQLMDITKTTMEGLRQLRVVSGGSFKFGSMQRTTDYLNIKQYGILKKKNVYGDKVEIKFCVFLSMVNNKYEVDKIIIGGETYDFKKG